VAHGTVSRRVATEEQLRLEYGRATALLDDLNDVRFKLLALVPTLAGTAVGLLRAGESAVTLLAVGILGLAATIGVLLYELRNTQTREELRTRIDQIEPALIGRQLVGSARSVKLFGFVPPRYETGVALVYAAALAGWGYLVAWGALAGLDVGHSRNIGVVIGAAWGLLVLLEVNRLD
jgi:hypothetical protein